MNRAVYCLALLSGFLGLPSMAAGDESRYFRVELRSGSVAIPFILELSGKQQAQSGVVHNGDEEIKVSNAVVQADRLVLDFPYYGSTIEARFDPYGTFKGDWKKQSRDGSVASMGVVGTPLNSDEVGQRFPRHHQITEEIVNREPVDGRWAVRFESEESPAVGVFEQKADGTVAGTFLTDTGDYRYLAGSYEHGLLRLSCFDGSHAFLFHATMQNDGTLKGDFWSGAKWHETWTAKRDATAQLADGFSLAKWSGKADFGAMKFKNTEGAEASVQSLVEGGKGAIIEVFGSWCPNCSDAGRMLAELDSRYRDKGLRIVGLAFEYTGQFERDVKQLRRFAERHGTTYPLLLGGKADKNEAAKTLPMLDRVVAFPTFIFAKSDGTIAAVYTGFSGPATGEEHERLKQRFVREIESLLGNPKSKH